MFFTLAVNMQDGSFFEYSTESIMKFLKTVQMLGNPDIEEVKDYEEIDIPDEIANYLVEGEEYEYDEDAGCWCWYDEEHEAWYWLDLETGEWLLVEDAEEYEVEEKELESV
jgi:hypothetical protein